MAALSADAPPNLLSLPTELLVRILADVHRAPISAEAARVNCACRAFRGAFASDAGLRARRVAWLLDPGWSGKRAALAAMRQLGVFVRIDAAALRRFEDEEATARLRSVAFLLSRCPIPAEPPSAAVLLCSVSPRTRPSGRVSWTAQQGASATSSAARLKRIAAAAGRVGRRPARASV